MLCSNCQPPKCEKCDQPIENKTERETLESLIAECKFSYCNSNIAAANFPDLNFTKRKTEILEISKTMTTAEIEKLMKEKNLEPATLVDLLHWSLKNQTIDFDLVALGSSWVSPDWGRNVPYLDEDGSRRKLNLRWDYPSSKWSDSCRFLAVSK